MSVFARLSPRLQAAIVSRLGWTSLRPVQEMAGEAILDGKNAVVLAPTAGGKTEASIFPALSMLMDAPVGSVGALYVAPIKALLNNQADRLGRYTEMVGLRRFVWHGDAGAGDKRRFLKEPAELLMTTPESLEVMLISRRVPTPRLFRDLRLIIVDEVHALAGTDRGAHLMCVMERLAALASGDVQRIGLSATVGNPASILAWLRGSSKREGVVVDPPKPAARREVKVIHRPDLPDLARDAAKVAKGQKSLFFCQSRATTEAVAERMRAVGTEVFVHHSAVSVEERDAAEARFQRGTDACIVCTSTLELGIDVGDLDRVFQVDAASTVSSFLQRMGRTGRRAGQSANTTFFCQNAWTVAQAIALVELAREGWVERVEMDVRCWPVLVHQLIAMSLAYGTIRPDDAWDMLSRVPDFGGISRVEYDRLVEHLVAEDYLYRSEDRLALGDRAEKVYGRKNFLQLYAVFSSPQTYTVITTGDRDVGYLYQDFVDRLVEEMSSFLLAGRPWLVHHIDHDQRRIRVVPAPRGTKPSWTGYVPQFLEYTLCQRIRDVLVSEAVPGILHESAAGALRELREDLGVLLRDGGDGVFTYDDHIKWWTFAGGRINTTLKYALHALGSWRIVTDNFSLRIEDTHLRHDEWTAARARLRDPGFWSDPEVWAAIRERLPAYRLSKFQQAMPDDVQREVLAKHLLDVERASAFCMGTGAVLH